MTEMNLIDCIKEITMRKCDAPEIFHIMLAYHVVSATLGMFFKPRTLKIKRPNVFFLISCIPGRGRRSTIMQMHNTLVDNSLFEFYKNVKNLDKEDAWHLVYLSEIQSGTEAGICDSIMEAIELGAISFRICSTEYGHVLKKIAKENDPTAGLDGLFCNLYSGEKFTQRLSRLSTKGKDNSRIIPKGLYVTMFSGMQEPIQYLSKQLSDSGFIRRLKIGFVKNTDFNMDNWKSPVEDDLDKVYSDDTYDDLRNIAKTLIFPRMEKYNKLLQKLQELRPNSKELFLNVYFTKKANKKIEDIARYWDEKVTKDASIYTIYQQTEWEYISTFAMLKAIAEDKWRKGIEGEEYKTGFLYIDECDVDEAIRINELIDQNSQDMMNMMEMTPRVRETETTLEKIERKIKEAGPKGLPHSKLLTSMPGWKSEDLMELIVTLKEKQLVESKTPEVQGKGRPGTFYVHRNYWDIENE